MKLPSSQCVFALTAVILWSTVGLGQDRGDRGGRGGWDRGDRADRGDRGFGGGSGGPPGGFGGPPGGFGGGFGGPPDGFGGGFGGPPGGDLGDRSSRFGSMMDGNGNGKIDQEEIDRMPSFVRDMMKARGVELKAGITLDEMRNNFRNSTNSGQPNSPNQPNGSPNTVKVLTPYKMKPKKPMTLTLPPAYSEIDSDVDGQIGLHEWMLTRRADIEKFDAMDLDHDGFLIPEELQAADTAAAGTAAVASTERKRLLIVNATPTKSPTAAPAGQQPNGDPNASQNNQSRGGWGSGDPGQMAAASFQRLDSNSDGFVDPAEWQQSRRTKGLFEQAGIRLDKMSLADFTAHYVRLTANGGGQ